MAPARAQIAAACWWKSAGIAAHAHEFMNETLEVLEVPYIKSLGIWSSSVLTVSLMKFDGIALHAPELINETLEDLERAYTLLF